MTNPNTPLLFADLAAFITFLGLLAFPLMHAANRINERLQFIITL